MSLVNKYKCKTREFSCGQFTEIIDHRIIRHPDEEIKIRKFVGKDLANAAIWLTWNFPVTPTVVKNNSCFIYSEPTTEKVKVYSSTCSQKRWMQNQNPSSRMSYRRSHDLLKYRNTREKHRNIVNVFRGGRTWPKCEQMTLPIIIKIAQSIHKFGWTAFLLCWHSNAPG